MDAIGAEVGQKMRSAIKAKLTELECYVDDELPDYIMVMVANKRSKSQMNEDLVLFLSNKTSTFVDWLHLVLKKLKEVTVTNPEVYKKATKRKSSNHDEDVKVKKEKHSKKHNVEVKKETEKSLTDDLPINIKSRLSDSRKVVLTVEKSDMNNFDIPLLPDLSNKRRELQDIEKQIKSVKSRLGDLVKSDDEEETLLRIKAEQNLRAVRENRKIQVQSDVPVNLPTTREEPTEELKKTERKKIVFTNDDDDDGVKTPPPRKRESVLSRLGKRTTPRQRSESPDRKLKKRDNGLDLSRRKRDGDKLHILKRLGVMSKVSVPEKKHEEPVDVVKEVKSVVTVRPRTIPPNAQQANKNLILKAVAEAQRSIAQTPNVGLKNKGNALFTRKYMEDKQGTKLVPEQTKTKLKNILVSINDSKQRNYSDSESEGEYIPKPVNKSYDEFSPVYTPTSPNLNIEITNELAKQNSGKRSPIVFDLKESPVKAKSNIPDKLPVVNTSTLLKKKETCIYFPNCRMGDKCEYQHVRKSCEMFPHCKFGDKCLYLHPSCKFGVSCTRKDCVYSHGKSASQTNVRACKFGKYCKNTSCKFNHSFSSVHRKMTV